MVGPNANLEPYICQEKFMTSLFSKGIIAFVA